MVDPRWRSVLTVAPYAVLALLTAFALATQWGDWRQVIPQLVLLVAYGLWVLTLRDLRMPWRDGPATVAVFITGAIAINFALVLVDSWFAFLTIATFSFAYSMVEWPWDLVAVAATAVVAGYAQASGFDDDPAGIVGKAVVILLNITVMCGLSWGLRLAQKQQERAATDAATAAERARLAREIHDTLAQGFTGVVTQLQAAEQAPDEESRRHHTDAALALARDGLAEARRSMQALRPAALEAGGLSEAIAAVARRWSERTGIPAELHTEGARRTLPTDVEVALLRTAQEALANVERHAHANKVVLTLRHDEHGARLEVRDDGRGFDVTAQRPDTVDGGYGLIAMRERIEALAGDLVVETVRGRGTAIRAEVPA